jgi:hypothetical protein
MTYGWALIVILTAIGTLAYVGVFNLDMFVVERCEFSSGIYCIDAIAETTGVKMTIQNGMTIDMEDVEVYLEECNPGTAATGPAVLDSGDQSNYELNCAIDSGVIFKSNIIFNYTNPDSGYAHSKLGRVVYRVP